MRDVLIPGDTIRAVLFDVDGTLYRHAPVRRAMAARLLRTHWATPRSGLRTTRILAAYRRAQEALRVSGFEGDVAIEQVARTAQHRGVDPSEVRELVTRWMESEPLDVVAANARAGLSEALDALRANGIKLAALSDYPAERKLEALGVADRFDAVVTAQDERVGAFKPNPRGLLVALDDLDVDHVEALYVGDRPDVDAPAAAAANVRCVLIGSTHRRSRDARVVQVSDLATIVDWLATP